MTARPARIFGIAYRCTVAEYSIRLPDHDGAISCLNEAEVRETLEEFRKRNPTTLWTGVMVHELKPGSTAGTERSPFDFIDD